MLRKKTDAAEQPIKQAVEYGDPTYGPEDDIYSKEEKVSFHQAGDDQESTEMDAGLDVPAASSDDLEEMIREEDEENNYYSLTDDDLEQSENDAE